MKRRDVLIAIFPYFLLVQVRIKKDVMLILAITYTLMLLISSIIPGESEAESLQFFVNFNPTIQNLVHIPAYTILSILWLSVSIKYEIIKRMGISGIFGFCCFWGILNELIQMVIPGRYPGLIDAALNSIGAGVGILIFTYGKDKVGKMIKLYMNGPFEF